MGGKPRARIGAAANGNSDNGHAVQKSGWVKPPKVKEKPVKLGFHRCGREAVYTGMTRLIPGGDIWLVAFRCDKCGEEFSQNMTWADAKKIRIRGYALEGRELCHCGDPVLDKDGKEHRHDDIKKETEKAEEKST